jgi:hypothetical protein
MSRCTADAIGGFMGVEVHCTRRKRAGLKHSFPNAMKLSSNLLSVKLFT